MKIKANERISYDYQPRFQVNITGKALKIEKVLGLAFSQDETFLYVVTQKSFLDSKGNSVSKNVITKIEILYNGENVAQKFVEDILLMKDEFFFNGLGLHY